MSTRSHPFVKSMLLGALMWMFMPIYIIAQGLPFQNYSIQTGLSQSVINDIFQDVDGYIWIGTEFGLNRFNKFEFEHFYESNGLGNNGVMVIAQLRDGRLLVGTESGLNQYDGSRFVRVPGAELLNQIQINSIFEDDSEGLWVGTEGAGLYYFFQDSFVSFTMNDGLADNIVRKVDQMPDGQILVATRSGVSLIYGGIVRKTWDETNGLVERRTRDLLVFPDNSFWIATRNGISIFSNGQFRHIGTEHGLVHPRVTSLEHDQSGGVWIATEGGVSHYRDGKFRNYSDMNGLSNNIINVVTRDYENNIWFGTYGGGVDLLPSEKFVHYTVQQGLLSNMVTSFAELDDRSIWIGTYGGGVSRINNGSVVNYTTTQGLVDNRVYTIFRDTDNSLMIGTRNGISRYRSGTMSTDPISDLLPDPKVRSIQKSENGDYWIGTYGGGLVQIRNNRVVKIWDTSTGFTDDIIMKVLLREDGSIWAATYGGINIIESDGSISVITVENGLLQNSILTILEDNDGRIWAGAFAGLSRIDHTGIKNYTTADGLQNSVIYFIEQDESGMLWLGSNDGLIRFDHRIERDIEDPERVKDVIKFKRYTTESGITADEMNANAVFTDSEGNIWMGSVGGVTKFKWEMDEPVRKGPPIHIERIRLFDGYVEVDRNYVFKHDQNFIGFEFVGISFNAPSEVLYEYRLRGIDQQWRRTHDRVVRYTTLPDGEFRFEVRARNADGYWSSQIASITVTISPPYWKSWWFILLIIILTLLTVGFLYNYYKISRQVDLERIRIRIASDLHDDVGASLTEIALNADFLQATQKDSKVSESLKQIGEMSRRIVTTMDDIVWSIDARNDTFGDLLDRMQDYATNVLTPVDIEPVFHFRGFESGKIMPLEIRQNVYLIFKEAVNNAAKHSKASKIEITFSRNDHEFELTIADNGVGMPEHIRSGGHGLKNMKLRAARIHAQIEIQNVNGLHITIKGKGL